MTAETPAREVPFTALDFETTGVVKGFASLPWQVGAVSLRAGRYAPEGPDIDTLLRVPKGYPFSRHAPGDHRARRDAIAAAPDALAVWADTLHPLLSRTVPVAHNASAERATLARLAPMTRYPFWVDTLRLARRAYPTLPGALDALIPALGLRPRLDALLPGRAPHDAFYDALACALLLEHILALPGWAALTLGEICEQ